MAKKEPSWAAGLREAGSAVAPVAKAGAAGAAASVAVAGAKEWFEKFLGSVPGGVLADIGLDYLESIVQNSIANNPVIRDRVREILERIPINKMGTINSAAISLIARKVEAMPGLDPHTRRFFTNAVRELADSVKDGVSDVSKYKSLVHDAVDAAAVETVSTTTGPLAGYTPEMPGAAHVVVRQIDGALAFECMLAIGGKVKVYGENRKTFADGVRIGTREEILALTHGNACPLCLGRRPVETTAAGEHAVHGAVAHAEDQVKTWFKDVGFIGVTVAMALVKTASMRAKDRFVSEDYLRELSTVDIEAWRAAAMQVFPRIIQKPNKPVHGTLTKADHDFLFTLIKGVGQGSLEPSTQFKRVLGAMYHWFTSKTSSIVTASRAFWGAVALTGFYAVLLMLAAVAFVYGILWVDDLLKATIWIAASTVALVILLVPLIMFEELVIKVLNILRKKEDPARPWLVQHARDLRALVTIQGGVLVVLLVLAAGLQQAAAAAGLSTDFGQFITLVRRAVGIVPPLLAIGVFSLGRNIGADEWLKNLTMQTMKSTDWLKKYVVYVGFAGIIGCLLYVGWHYRTEGGTRDLVTWPSSASSPNVTQNPVLSTPSTAGKTKVATNTKADMARRLQAKLCPDPDLDPDYRRALRCP